MLPNGGDRYWLFFGVSEEMNANTRYVGRRGQNAAILFFWFSIVYAVCRGIWG